MSALATSFSIQDFAAQQKRGHIKTKNGDAIGPNFTTPKSDFSRFLGMKAPTKEELSGEKKVDGWRAIEIALQKDFQKVGESTAKDGQDLFAAMGTMSAYENPKPGTGDRTIDMLKDGMHAMTETMEMSQQQNVKYLEMQYKFQWQSTSYGTISNLMKARSDSIKKCINEVR